MNTFVSKKKKQAITLLEIMVVIFLIGLIGSVVGYNVKGSLEEGKAFRSEQGRARLKDILLMEAADGTPLSEIVEDPLFYVKRSKLSNDPSKLLKDGWGKPYEIHLIGEYDLSISSEALSKYKEKKNRKAKTSERAQDQDEEFEEE